MIKRLSCFLLSIALLAMSLQAEGKSIGGTVRDNSGRPLGGVVISDGFTCVATSADGTWVLETPDPEALFVTCSYPETSVIPMVDGRPCLYLPLGKGCRSYDFVIEKAEKETDFTMVCVGDPQVSEYNHGLTRFENETLKDINSFVSSSVSTPVYVFTLGDHVHNEWRTFPKMNALLDISKVGAPCFSVIGNHDHQPKDTDFEARRSYQEVFGPVNYSFNRGDVHIVVMDNILFSGKKMKEALTEKDYRWLRQDLSFVDKKKALVILTHATMAAFTQPELYELMSQFAQARLVSGHSHSVFHNIFEVGGKEIYRDVVGTANGVDWAGTICGDGAPMGYAVYEFSGPALSYHYYKPVGYDRDFQIRMYRACDFNALSRPLLDNKYRDFDWDHTPGTVILNIWNYNPKWKISVYENGIPSDVEVILDNGMNDLWACNYFYIEKNRWTGSYCQRRNHLFRFVPKDSNAEIRVQVEDEFGNVYSQDRFTTTIDSAGTYEASLPSSVRPHPYLFLTDDALISVKSRIADGDEATTLMHKLVMEMADSSLSAPALGFELDGSGRRILHVSRRAMMQISSCAYAWRYTGDSRYLDRAIHDLESVCSFDSWNPSHFLDVAEMATAVSVGYDWLYRDLPEELRRRIETVIPEYVFKPALAPHPYFGYVNNWNEVCNAGTVIAALAIYPKNHPFVLPFLDKAVLSNRIALRSYAPGGICPEGPAYWLYGTMYEVLLITALNDVLGTDYGLYEQKGFMKTADFIRFASYGAAGDPFNYSDCVSRETVFSPLWYFAWKQHDPSLLNREMELLREGRYRCDESDRSIPLLMRYVAEIDWGAAHPQPQNYFSGKGRTPLIMAHTDWTYSESDRFLGIKGGTASAPHGHMDAGEFVYDAYGYRWSADICNQDYSELEVAMKEVGGNLWDFSMDSMRWEVLRNNNLFHSTLTINGADHLVEGVATTIDEFNDDRAMGGTFDLSSVFADEAESVIRTVKLVDGKYVEVTDVVTALAGKDAEVHWNMTTPASVRVCRDRIELRQGRHLVRLRTVSDGPRVSYAQWPTDPKEYGNPLAGYEAPVNGVNLCGFESTVPAGTTATFVTVLK